mgnify:CR=1 FL=1|jgi:hypothetical protein
MSENRTRETSRIQTLASGSENQTTQHPNPVPQSFFQDLELNIASTRSGSRKTPQPAEKNVAKVSRCHNRHDHRKTDSNPENKPGMPKWSGNPANAEKGWKWPKQCKNRQRTCEKALKLEQRLKTQRAFQRVACR